MKTLHNIAFLFNEFRENIKKTVNEGNGNLDEEVYDGIFSDAAKKIASISSANASRVAIGTVQRLGRFLDRGTGKYGIHSDYSKDDVERALDGGSFSTLVPQNIAKMSRATAGLLSTNALKVLDPLQVKEFRAKHLYAMDQVRVQAIPAAGIAELPESTTSKLLSKTLNAMTAEQLKVVKWGSIAPRTIAWIALNQIKSLDAASIDKLGEAQISRMTARQLDSINPDAIKKLKVEFISSKALGKISLETVGHLDKNQISRIKNTKKLSVNQLNAISNEAIVGLNISEVSLAKIGKISADKIKLVNLSKLSGDQVAKMKASQFNAIGEKLKEINSENIAKISTKEFAGIDGVHFSSFPEATTFTSRHIKAVTGFGDTPENATAKLAWLNKQKELAVNNKDTALEKTINLKIANFYTPKLTALGRVRDWGFPSENINRMGELAVKSALDPGSASRLSPNKIGSLSNATLKKIKPEVFSWMGPAQYLKMTGRQFNVLNDDQIKKIPESAILSLYQQPTAGKNYRTPKISSNVLNKMIGDQLACVNIKRISPRKLSKILPEKFKSIPMQNLNKNQLKKVTSAQLNALGDKIATIKPKVFATIGPKKFGRLNADTLSSLSEKHVQALKTKHISSIKLEAKANKDADSVPTDDQRDKERAAKSDWLKKQKAGLDAKIKNPPEGMSQDEIKALTKLSASMGRKYNKLNPSPTLFAKFKVEVDRRFTASKHINMMTDEKLEKAVDNKKSRLHPDNIGKLHKGTIKRLDSRIIASLRGAQIIKLKTRHFNRMNADQIQAIAVDAISAIRPGAIRSLTEETFAKFSPDQIGALRTNQINAMQTKHFNALNKEQIQKLDLSGISKETTGRIYSKVFNAMTPSQIKTIQVEHISLKTIHLISPEQIAHFTPDQTGKLTEKQLAKMTSKQFNSMDAKAFQMIKIASVRPSVIARITPEQIGNLTPKQVGELTGPQIRKMDSKQLAPDIIKHLSMEQIGKFNGAQIAGMRSRQFYAMDTDQFQSITPKALGKMNPYTFAKVKVELLNSMKDEQVLALSSKMISKMNVTQLKFEGKAAWLEKQIEKLTNEIKLAKEKPDISKEDQKQIDKKSLIIKSMQGKLEQFKQHQQKEFLEASGKNLNSEMTKSQLDPAGNVIKKTPEDRGKQLSAIYNKLGEGGRETAKSIMDSLGIDPNKMTKKEFNKFAEVMNLATPLLTQKGVDKNLVLSNIKEELNKSKSGGMKLFSCTWAMHKDKFSSVKSVLAKMHISNARETFKAQGLDNSQAIIATNNWSKAGLTVGSADENPLTKLQDPKNAEQYTAPVLMKQYKLSEDQAKLVAAQIAAYSKENSPYGTPVKPEELAKFKEELAKFKSDLAAVVKNGDQSRIKDPNYVKEAIVEYKNNCKQLREMDGLKLTPAQQEKAAQFLLKNSKPELNAQQKNEYIADVAKAVSAFPGVASVQNADITNKMQQQKVEKEQKQRELENKQQTSQEGPDRKRSLSM